MQIKRIEGEEGKKKPFLLVGTCRVCDFPLVIFLLQISLSSFLASLQYMLESVLTSWFRWVESDELLLVLCIAECDVHKETGFPH